MMTAREFTDRLSSLLRREQHAMAEFIAALAEFDTAELWRDLGYTSLFYFLHRELKLSSGAAYYRKVGAELVRRYPGVLDALRDGRLCITALPELAKVLTSENSAAVLPRFFRLSRREAQVVAVELNPVKAGPRREVVTPLARPSGRKTEPPAPALASAPPPVPAALSASALGPVPTPALATPEPAPAPLLPFQPAETPREPTQHAAIVAVARLASVQPLSAELRRLHITVPQRFLDKLDEAKVGMSHAWPDAGSVEVLEEALDLLLERQAGRRGQVARPLSKPRPSKSDRIPAHVKRAVFLRDGGCCQWALESGGICGSRRRIEFDHRHPRGQGGPPTVENVRLLCHFHNQLAARHAYGDDWMDCFTGPRARERVAVYRASSPPPPEFLPTVRRIL